MFLTLIFLFFLIKLLRDSLFYVWLWQVKEYRMDRMMSHLKESTSSFDKKNGGIMIAIILFLSYFVFLENYFLVFQYLVLAFFVFAVLQISGEIKSRSLKKPKPTLKIMLIYFLLAVVYLLIGFCWSSSSAIFTTEEAKLPIGSLASGVALMLFILIVNPLVISSIILAIEPIFYFQKKRIIKRATEKMQRLKKIKTIGITGSYGKTSTKEFLYSILSRKFKVVKTEGNNNTNIGVAYTVLNKVSDDCDYFICEMGAYKIGEIKEICDIVKPRIGILTGINEQHIDLFGSRENIVKAKFELIEALPENGMAVINEKCKYQNEKLKFKVRNLKYFSLDRIKNVKVHQDYVEFEYVVINNLTKLKLNLLGKHYIENVLFAITVAEYLGMSLEEIKNAIEKIKPTEYMMRKTDGSGGSMFIDDSYSANSDGVLAALDYLDEAYFDYKKIIVFPGIIELGRERDKIYKMLYNRINKVCDVAYILESGKRKAESGDICKFVFEKDFDEVANMLKNDLDRNTVVLFESRGAGAVMRKLKSEKLKIKNKKKFGVISECRMFL